MKISKKLENLYVRDCLTNERELNYQLGFRGVEVKFANKVDFVSEFEGEEYLICFEKFLNTCEKLDFYIYDGSSSVICNIAEMTIVVNDEQLDMFNNLYKYYKKNYEEIIDGFRREAEEIEADMAQSEKESKTAVELRKEVLLPSEPEIKVIPVIEVNNLSDYEAEKRKLYLEFELMIKNNTNWQNEIIAVEKKDNVQRQEIMQCMFLAHINQLSPEWVELHVHHKDKWEFSDIIIKWARMAELDYRFSKIIVWKS